MTNPARFAPGRVRPRLFARLPRTHRPALWLTTLGLCAMLAWSALGQPAQAPQRFTESAHAGRAFDPPDVPKAEELTVDFRAALEPAMKEHGYAPEEIDLLARTAAKVFLSQLTGSLEGHEKLMGELGGKLRARSAPAEMRERAVQEVAQRWRPPEAGNAPARVDLSRLSCRVFDRKTPGVWAGSEKLPKGKAFFVSFSQYDWGIDTDKLLQGACDLVELRMPVRDQNGLDASGTLAYLRHPGTRQWIPLQMTFIHAVGQPYPQVNF